jgi:hypothetical protein
MEKSIESIWKEGFLKSDALIAPKINALYTQKSKHIVDKIFFMGKINLLLIAVFGLSVMVGLILTGEPYLGVYLGMLISTQVLLGLRHAKETQKINKNVSSYYYIKAFDNWLKESMREYTILNRFFYPLLFLGFIAQFRFSEEGKQLITFMLDKNPDTFLVYGIPLILVLAVAFMAGVLAVSAGVIYRFDIKLVYGRIIKRLDELILDMDELRK